MASKNYFKKLKEKFIIVLSVLCLFSFSAFALIGCKDDDKETYDDETYSVTTEDNGLISNSNFSFNDDFIKIDDKDFPLTSPTGWTRAVDSAPSSAIDSGVVSVNTESWKVLLSKLYDDADFSNYLQSKYDYKVNDIKRQLNSETPDKVTDEEVKNHIIDNLLIGTSFKNGNNEEIDNDGAYKTPGVHDGATDNYVYMLNNYSASIDFGKGTAQKATSTSTVTLDKNKTYKISVWVKTINLSSPNPNGDYGATIRLTNNFNSTLQAEYRITNIVANDWTKYSLYIKTDKDYGASFSLALGLGLGNGSNTNAKYWTEGTALFDDITVEEVEATSIPAEITTSNLLYGSTKIIEQKTNLINKTEFLYDLDITQSISLINGGLKSNYVISEQGLTKSNIIGSDGTTPITSKNFDIDSSAEMTKDGEIYKIELKNSSYTIKLTSEDFKLTNTDKNNYAYLTFDVKSDLIELAHKSVTVDIVDKYNGTEVNRASVASYTQEKVGEWTKLGLLIKNNFDYQEREFDVKITFGPSNLADIKYTTEFATGTIWFTNFRYLTASLDADEYITPEYDDGADNPAYKLIKLFENSGSVTSLYAGYSEDYKDTSDKTVEYAIKSAPSNMGEILTAPTNATGFTGVTYNHSYVKKQVPGETLETAINDRKGLGNQKGQAGLINTKYLATYGSDIESAMQGAFKTEEPLQVLMINNKVEDSYGYITPSKTLTAKTYAKASATVRVLGNAKAYIYLVNTINEEKEVMHFVDFTVNTDIVHGVENGKQISASSNKFELVVDSNMMNADGWVTVEFYLATGEKDKQFRLEVWNGARDGQNKSQGFVFIKNAEIKITSDEFTIPARWADSFSEPTSPLFGASRENLTLYAYQQVLNENEIAYNKEYPESAVSYNPHYVWAKNKTLVFASYTAIECAETNPYESITPEEEETGCTAQTDPSTFWLSFSSVLLAVVLIIAIIVLFIKNIRRRRKYYGKENKKLYRVQSRITTHRNNQRKLQELANKDEIMEDDTTEELTEETTEETPVEESESETIEEQVNPEEQDLDSYVYGEVQDFGESPEEDKNK